MSFQQKRTKLFENKAQAAVLANWLSSELKRKFASGKLIRDHVVKFFVAETGKLFVGIYAIRLFVHSSVGYLEAWLICQAVIRQHLLTEVSEMVSWEELRKSCYGQNVLQEFEKGVINFDPNGMAKVRNGVFKSYDEYLAIQKQSCEAGQRRYFGKCYYYAVTSPELKGKIERFDTKHQKVVFNRIVLDALFSDGIGFFGKEDHVWMDAEPFKDFAAGDSVSFFAEVVCYMKFGNGKQIDYALENPSDVQKIGAYDVPTDDDLIEQQIEELVCETCKYYDQCYLGNCIADEREVRERIELLKNFDPGKFTPFTVLLAYELEYRMFLQHFGSYEKMRKEWRNPTELVFKCIDICESVPVYYVGDMWEAMVSMTHPEKPRMYIGE